MLTHVLRRWIVVLSFAVVACELPEKEVGLEPEPEPDLAIICLDACQHRTACTGEEPYACLAECTDDLLNAASSSCREAKVTVHECHVALACEPLAEAFADPDRGACADEVAAERIHCGSAGE